MSADRCNVRQPPKSATGRSTAIGMVMCHCAVYKEVSRLSKITTQLFYSHRTCTLGLRRTCKLATFHLGFACILAHRCRTMQAENEGRSSGERSGSLGHASEPPAPASSWWRTATRPLRTYYSLGYPATKLVMRALNEAVQEQDYRPSAQECEALLARPGTRAPGARHSSSAVCVPCLSWQCAPSQRGACRLRALFWCFGSLHSTRASGLLSGLTGMTTCCTVRRRAPPRAAIPVGRHWRVSPVERTGVMLRALQGPLAFYWTANMPRQPSWIPSCTCATARWPASAPRS